MSSRKPLSVPADTIQGIEFLGPDGSPLPGRVHISPSGIELEPIFGPVLLLPWETMIAILESPETQQQLERSALLGDVKS